MPLRVELGPFERIIIGGSVITNSNTRTSFRIDGEAPLLRERDIITAESADTPVKRIYYCVQMMYLEDDLAKYQGLYLGFMRDLLEAVPSSRDLLQATSTHIIAGAYYNALKEIKKLIKLEEKLLT